MSVLPAKNRFKWFVNDGFVGFFGHHSRRYEKVCDERWPAKTTSHMRMGRFAVVVAPNDVMAAQTYDVNDMSDYHVKRNSKHWGVSRRDRLSQIELVTSRLRDTHPLYAEIMNDIQKERDFLR